MPLSLPRLPFQLDALEPVISAACLKAHHLDHHRGFVRSLNQLVKDTDLESSRLDVIVRRSAHFATASARAASIYRNAAEAWNHAFFWHSLRPARHASDPPRELASRMIASHGSVDGFLAALKAAAMRHFGSGWAWVLVEDGGLSIATTANADTPIARGREPLLAIDLWEHAWCPDYRASKAAYVSGVVDTLLNWEQAERNFLSWLRDSQPLETEGERA